MNGTIAVIGATGMLGRPVVRVLLDSGFRVRALTRDAARARPLLPPAAEVVQVDYGDDAALADAIRGADAVYANLNSGRRERDPDPTVPLTRRLIALAPDAGVRRLAAISALEADVEDAGWWDIRRKQEADRLLLDAPTPATVYRPGWFMESLAEFRLARGLMMHFRAGGLTRRWLAGEDHGRVVAHTLTSPAFENQIVRTVGPEALGFPAAVRRFADAIPGRHLVLPVPDAAIALGARLSPKARYLHDLLAVTRRTPEPERTTPAPAPECPTTIEAYAATILASATG